MRESRVCSWNLSSVKWLGLSRLRRLNMVRFILQRSLIWHRLGYNWLLRRSLMAFWHFMGVAQHFWVLIARLFRKRLSNLTQESVIMGFLCDWHFFWVVLLFSLKRVNAHLSAKVFGLAIDRNQINFDTFEELEHWAPLSLLQHVIVHGVAIGVILRAHVFARHPAFEQDVAALTNALLLIEHLLSEFFEVSGDFANLWLALKRQSCGEFWQRLVLPDVTNTEKLTLNGLGILGSIARCRRATVHIKRPFPHLEKRTWSGDVSDLYRSTTKLTVRSSTLNWVVEDLVLLRRLRSHWSQRHIEDGTLCLLCCMHDWIWVVLELLDLDDAGHWHYFAGSLSA